MFNLDFPESNHLAKTLTIVSGPDTVNLTYHNFFASKEKVTQVKKKQKNTVYTDTFCQPPLVVQTQPRLLSITQ